MKRRNHHPTVEDFMSTAVITMKESDTLSAAQIEMQMAEIRHLPVIDDYSLVSVISMRDIAAAVDEATNSTSQAA